MGSQGKLPEELLCLDQQVESSVSKDDDYRVEANRSAWSSIQQIASADDTSNNHTARNQRYRSHRKELNFRRKQKKKMNKVRDGAG
mmetsp:Transcript_15295/g.20515  ORF Transcript_15295/g.20515 Transcript_15295/m.20515 type:complete len:86 (-) Transcript_15295:129-386(-)